MRAEETSYDAVVVVWVRQWQWQWQLRPSWECCQWSLCCGIQWSVPQSLFNQCISSIWHGWSLPSFWNNLFGLWTPSVLILHLSCLLCLLYKFFLTLPAFKHPSPPSLSIWTFSHHLQPLQVILPSAMTLKYWQFRNYVSSPNLSSQLHRLLAVPTRMPSRHLKLTRPRQNFWLHPTLHSKTCSSSK